jgi:hypothetical protein
MTTIDFSNIENELVVFARNSDIFSTTERGVTTKTDTLSGDGSETEFDLTETNPKNVRSVTVDGAVLTRYEDYTVDYSTAKVTFTTAPSNDTDNIEIEYDYGTGDKIYPDFPRTDLSINSYPRIAISITSGTTEDGDTNGDSQYSDFMISFYIYANGRTNLNNYHKTLREKIINNKKNFYYLRYMKLASNGPVINEPARADKILTRTLECTSPLNEED